MKTEQFITIQQIKSIISPVRVLKVEDWVDIGVLLKKEKGFSRLIPESNAVYLLSRYESLTSQPLTKEMFVCEKKEPVKPVYGAPLISCAFYHDEDAYRQRLKAYQAALKKIWFEGFEISESEKIAVASKEVINIYLYPDGQVYIYFNRKSNLTGFNPTVSDLIIEISRYNSTASKPVEINVTDSFIQELIK